MKGPVKIIIASGNPVKVNSTKNAFKKMFPEAELDVQPAKVGSGVGAQPMTTDETFTGAMNRASKAKEKEPVADFWVGIEGGLHREGDEVEAFAWVVILNANMSSKSRTGNFYLPKKTIELIDQGYELGKADDIIFDMQNSKEESGSVGILTGNVVDRTVYYEQAVVLALIPFKNKDLY